MDNWYGVASPDYFNSICINGPLPTQYGYDVPANVFGYSNSKQGNAYVGISVYQGINSEYKEYIYQQLQNPLQAGKVYCLSFWVSRADRNQYAIKQIGAYFRNSLPTLVSGSYINGNPQVVNQNGFITDTIGWQQIQGCFTAQGGEQYVIFGNFNSNTNTDTLYAGTNNPDPNYPGVLYSYYYIDDINLVEDNSTNVNELSFNGHFNLHPNPNNGYMILDYNLGNYANAKFNLFDITGKLVQTKNITSNEGSLFINEQNLDNGIYFYSILVGEKTIKTDKVVIIK